MSSSNLASSATSSPNRVRFNPDIASPLTGRPRRSSLPYPKVAQSKGSADRKFSFDLFWKLHSLSAISNIITIDTTDEPESSNNVNLPEVTTKNAHAASSEPVPRTPSRPRHHNYIVVSRKQKEALLKSEDSRLKALLVGGERT